MDEVKPNQKITDLMEPFATQVANGVSDKDGSINAVTMQAIAVSSIAVSLKRIADGMEKR